MVTIITEPGAQEISAQTERATRALWMAPADVERLLGWSLKPEGLCRGPVCVPLSGQAAKRHVRADAIDIAGLWRHMKKPLRCTDDKDIWLFGEGASARTAALKALEAPDFTLPDLDGKLHALSSYRGKKVLLATWASW
jgi:hypothetical protein